MGRVVVVGAGIIGAACAYYAARSGAEVTVVDAARPAGGTTSRCEGNLLLSDKSPGPELDLMLLSRRLWLELGEDLGADRIELDAKGGLVVATSESSWTALRHRAQRQVTAGVQAEPVQDPRRLEPYLADGLAGAMSYPQDLQVQPVLAATALLRAAVRRGARLHVGRVVGLRRDRSGALVAVRTDRGELAASAVVNATGVDAGPTGEAMGAPLPISPRRGFLLVTEPIPPIIGRKVYAADYVDTVASSRGEVQTSCVVERTRAGTVLVGSSRERSGYDASPRPDILASLAADAVRLFPALAAVQVIRSYHGYRPYCPDHLPVIGPDPRAPGVVHACGHEGAGIGLAPATGLVVATYLRGQQPAAELGVDVASMLPSRFTDGPTPDLGAIR